MESPIIDLLLCLFVPTFAILSFDRTIVCFAAIPLPACRTGVSLLFASDGIDFSGTISTMPTFQSVLFPAFRQKTCFPYGMFPMFDIKKRDLTKVPQW